MTAAELRRAAHHLTVNAKAMRSCATIGGKWPDNERETKAEHADYLALARKLRTMARRTRRHG